MIERQCQRLIIGIEVYEHIGSYLMMGQLCAESDHISIIVIELIGNTAALEKSAEVGYYGIHYYFIVHCYFLR